MRRAPRARYAAPVGGLNGTAGPDPGRAKKERMGPLERSETAGTFAAVCVGIVLLFSLTGCGGDVPEESRDGTGSGGKNAPATVEFAAAGDAGGDVILREVPHAVEVELRMVGLPETGAVYVAHIRGGTCAEGRDEGQHGTGHHGGEGHGSNGDGSQAKTPGVTEFPLSLLMSDGGGRGASTTLLRRVSLEGLLSGEPPRRVSVSASGRGGPREVACADLGRGRG